MKQIFLILFLLLTACANAQQVAAGQENTVNRINYDLLASQQIKDLKQGVLMVRLQTKAKSISAMREQGNNDLADKIEKLQNETNKAIIKAFKENFKFCPVYFFFSQYSINILERQFEKVLFLNDSLLPDPNIKLSNTNFLTAEFGAISQDTAQYFDGYYYVHGEEGLEQETKSYGSSNMGFNALIIKSDKFVQLHKPFPYYARQSNPSPTFKDFKKSVVKMDKRLSKYYLGQNQ
jgi:hypothetical protein